MWNTKCENARHARKCPNFFLVDFEQVSYKKFFVWKSFVAVVYENCKSNVAAQKKWRAVVVLKTYKKLTCGSSFYNLGGRKTQMYVKRLKRTMLQKSTFKVTNKGKSPPMIFPLTCDLLIMDAYCRFF